jgi:hypothetical protein
MLKSLSTTAALLLLVGCSQFDENKELAACRKTYPNPIDRLAVDNCVETKTLKWVEANAWFPRLRTERERMP